MGFDLVKATFEAAPNNTWLMRYVYMERRAGTLWFSGARAQGTRDGDPLLVDLSAVPTVNAANNMLKRWGLSPLRQVALDEVPGLMAVHRGVLALDPPAQPPVVAPGPYSHVLYPRYLRLTPCPSRHTTACQEYFARRENEIDIRGQTPVVTRPALQDAVRAIVAAAYPFTPLVQFRGLELADFTLVVTHIECVDGVEVSGESLELPLGEDKPVS